MASPLKKPPIVMVSSTVYGIEDLLDQIYTALAEFGYEVWCSHAGTVQAFSNKHAFDNCLKAVEDCDLFLGLITPKYGSGVLRGEISITHQELVRAVELNKPRWFLAHDHVVFARRLLAQLPTIAVVKACGGVGRGFSQVIRNIRLGGFFQVFPHPIGQFFTCWLWGCRGPRRSNVAAQENKREGC